MVLYFLYLLLRLEVHLVLFILLVPLLLVFHLLHNHPLVQYHLVGLLVLMGHLLH